MRRLPNADPAADRPPTVIDRLRENVAIRVQATSLRSVARQVGMSPSGLEKFLQGGVPYTASRRKLLEWWSRERHRVISELTADGVAGALGRLVRDLPADRQEPAMAELVATLRTVYAGQDGPFPPWLDELAVRLSVIEPPEEPASAP